jgi:hypothetical protein
MNFWVVKSRLRKDDGSEGWHWENYFEGDAETGKNWGGSEWIKSNESKKYIREDVRKGDLVVCYQSDNQEIWGLTKMLTDGQEDQRDSNEFNVLNFSAPNNAFALSPPLKLQKLKENHCNPKCFEPGRQGTIFPIIPKEFKGVLSVIVKNSPHLRDTLDKWLRKGGYSPEIVPPTGERVFPPKGGAGFGGDPIKNKRVERKAINFVSTLLKSEGWDVETVEQQKCGYDLKCRKQRKEIDVEVKGVSGNEVAFPITAGEIRQAIGNNIFRLYCVTRALSNRPKYYFWHGKEFMNAFDLLPTQYIARLRKPD